MTTYLDQHMDSASFRRTLAEEGLVVEAMELIAQEMEHAGVNRAQLAELLDVSKSNITQMLRGRNIKLKTLARVFHALDAAIVLSVRREDAVQSDPPVPRGRQVTAPRRWDFASLPGHPDDEQASPRYACAG